MHSYQIVGCIASICTAHTDTLYIHAKIHLPSVLTVHIGFACSTFMPYTTLAQANPSPPTGSCNCKELLPLMTTLCLRVQPMAAQIGVDWEQ